MQKIMIIEDDPATREELVLLLKNESYQPVPVTDFTDILSQVMTQAPDLILLDLGLPGRNGLSLCADIRKSANMPIIFVTSRNSAIDELKALSLGGDDYITKPYNILVLLARIRAALRRSSAVSDSEILEAKGLKLNLLKGVISADGQELELTRNELRILAHLMTHAGEIVSRAELIDILWEHQIYIDDNTLSVNMTRLRTKLEMLGLSDFIRTRRGMGYQL
ncbi:MAG: response regulator transcription factor [Dorea sp.]|nr:response regulator transcription factor [Dorea sp.]